MALTQVQGGMISSLPTGSVVQVISSTQTSTQAITGSSTWTDLSNLSVSITPKSSTNKILVSIVVNCYGAHNAWFRLMRGSTAIGVGDASGSVSRTTMGNGYLAYASNNNSTGQFASQYLDSPATTSSTTYKIQGYADNGAGSGSLYINYNTGESNAAYAGRSISTITVMEIVA